MIDSVFASMEQVKSGPEPRLQQEQELSPCALICGHGTLRASSDVANGKENMHSII